MSTAEHIAMWYLVFSISGICFWMVFHGLFSKLIDKGYALSKFIPLALIALFLWTIGFVFKVQINSLVIWVTYLGLCVLCIGYLIITKKDLSFVSQCKKSIILVEIVFILTTIFGLYVVSIHPVIDNGTERMMDFSILNVLTTDSTLPAKDVWLSGNNINYYYFGPFLLSLVNKMTGTNSLDGYLYALGFIFGITSSIIFTIGASVKRKWWMGIVAIFMTMFLSNFDYIYQYFIKYWKTNPDYKSILTLIVLSIIATLVVAIIKNIKHKRLLYYLGFNLILALLYFFVIDGVSVVSQVISFFTSPTFSPTFFWDNSRVIPYTINEFPYYSLIIGDLHPHYIDLMFFVTNIALLFVEFEFLTPQLIGKINFKDLRVVIRNKKIQKLVAIKLISLLILAGGIATNSWEIIVFGLFFGVKDFIFLIRCLEYKFVNKLKFKRFIQISLIPIIFDAFVYIGAYIIQTPYFKSVNLPVAGIKFNSELSPEPQFLVLYAISFTFAIIGLGVLIAKLIKGIKLKSQEFFVLALFMTSLIVVLFSEFFFVSDLFYFDNYIYKRANTVFKVNYMGFVMFGIASCWVIFILMKKIKMTDKVPKFPKFALISFYSYIKVCIAIVVCISITYIPESLAQWSAYHIGTVGRYTIDAQDSTKGSTVTFTNLAKQTISVSGSDLIDASTFLKSVKKSNDVLIEAPGEAYQFTSIGATFSTMPDVIGWVSHEAQWRKYTNLDSYIKDFNASFKPEDLSTGESKDELLRKYLSSHVTDLGRFRETDVNNFFNLNPGFEDILAKYNVTYIWYGPIEKTKYGADFQIKTKDNPNIKKIFSNTTIDIYKYK